MNALEWVKQQLNSPEAILLVVDNKPAKDVLLAWTYYRPFPFTDPLHHKNDDPEQVLIKLWSYVQPVDFERLGMISGMPASVAERIFWQLTNCRLIWPDGTISDDARKLLTTEATLTARGWKKPKGSAS